MYKKIKIFSKIILTFYQMSFFWCNGQPKYKNLLFLSSLTTLLINHGNQEYSDFFHKKYSEVTKFQRKRALALTARKFVRLIFSMLQKNQLYINPKEMIKLT